MRCEGVRVVVNCFTYTSVYDKLVDHGICSPALPWFVLNFAFCLLLFWNAALFSIFAGFCCALSFIFCINTRQKIFRCFPTIFCLLCKWKCSRRLLKCMLLSILLSVLLCIEIDKINQISGLALSKADVIYLLGIKYDGLLPF